MAEDVLAGCRVLVAEDEYLLASDTARLFSDAGAIVIGPFGKLAQLQEQVLKSGFDVAVLDIRLGYDLVYSVADLISQSNVPIAFLTGSDAAAIPPRFAQAPHCQKPCPDDTLISIVQELCAG